MARVRILTDRVANQIAAGEVIERPAAVVKELVENALDAGATRIEVEFRHGGRSLMRIEDNGHGMSRDDALLALERHATSKIAEAADLDRLSTFGFRGEALPSIASVSRFLLQTREANSDAGTEILVNGGKFVHVKESGQPVGTRMEVTHLFNSVPARRKFLKTDQTEAAHIVQCVRLYALASPQVAFTLIEDGRVIFRSPQCSTLLERVAEIFGRQIADALVPIEMSEQGMRLTGLIGRPAMGRSTRHEMITFVNSRPVDSRTLNYALIESYHDSLAKGRYPLAFVFFDLDPAAVDVNVHPAKREVRFRSEPAVRAFVIRSVLQRLREMSETPSSSGSSGNSLTIEKPVPGPVGLSPASATSTWTYGAQISSSGMGDENTSQEISQPPGVKTNFSEPVSVRLCPKPDEAAAALATQTTSLRAGWREPVTAWRFVGLAHGSYALFETTAGLVLLDRRAAHERVWFERLQEQFRSGAVPSQRLLLPVPVELDPVASASLLERLPFLNAHGFEISEFGRNFFRVEGVPVWMEPADAEPFLRDLLGAFRDGHLPENNRDLAREELARLAAAKAVRLPSTAGETELRALLGQLFASRSPLTSPAGKPTYIELNHSELARRFQK